MQEAFFFQTFLEPSAPNLEIRQCRLDNICVESAIHNSNICYLDDGNPLYTFQCGTFTPKCIFGVASYHKNQGQFCNGGSFFANVPLFARWINSTMISN